MALDVCVKEILCTLSVPVLNSVKALITTIEVIVNAQLLAITSQLLALDILLAPITLALGLAEEIIDQFKVIGTLIPVSTMEECVDLGDIVVGIDDIASRATASLQDFRQDAIRALSIREELVALQAALNQLLVDFSALKALIDVCVVENQ